MSLWVRTGVVSAALALGVVAGCGGNVVVDGGLGGGGSGGSGDGGSTGTFTTGTSPQTTNVSSSVTTSVTSSVTTTTSFVSSSSGPMGCDNTGDCGEGGETGCIGCAVKGPCAEVYAKCVNSMECMDFLNCTSNCDPNNSACLQACSSKYPEGSQQYLALFVCVLCDQCPNDCSQYQNQCP